MATAEPLLNPTAAGGLPGGTGLVLTTGGVGSVAVAGTDYVAPDVAIAAGKKLIIDSSTSTASVALQVAGDPNTGIGALAGADTVSLVCGGNGRVNATAAGGSITGVWTFSGNITFDGGSRIIGDTAVSLTSVAYSFSGDPNTGIGRIGGADTIGLVAGGVEAVRAVADAATADTETNMLVRRNVGAAFTQQRVSMGAADSGGAGFKLLRVPN